MEDQYMPFSRFLRQHSPLVQQFQAVVVSVNVDGSFNMAAFVFVGKTAVDYCVRVNNVLVDAN